MSHRSKYYLLVLLVVVGVAACNSRFSSNAPFRSPEASEVVEMSASLYNRPDDGVDIPAFRIPRGEYAGLLCLFDGAKRDPHPANWQILGIVHIKTNAGEIPIELFWTGGPTGAFAASRRYYRGSSDDEIIRTIVAAREKS